MPTEINAVSTRQTKKTARKGQSKMLPSKKRGWFEHRVMGCEVSVENGNGTNTTEPNQVEQETAVRNCY